jgi:hypothetical protein
MTPGDWNISTHNIQNTVNWHNSRMWLFAVHTDAMNPFGIVHSTLTIIQLKTGKNIALWNTLETLKNQSPYQHHLFCRKQKHTQALVLCWTINLQSDGNKAPKVALRGTVKIIHTTHFRCFNNSSIPSVGWRRRAWRHTMTAYERTKPLLGSSQASKQGIVGRWFFPGCKMIRRWWQVSNSAGPSLLVRVRGGTARESARQSGTMILNCWIRQCSIDFSLPMWVGKVYLQNISHDCHFLCEYCMQSK